MAETLDCRSPRACATCPHSDRAGQCMLEAAVDVALEALAAPRRVIVVASVARRASA